MIILYNPGVVYMYERITRNIFARWLAHRHIEWSHFRDV